MKVRNAVTDNVDGTRSTTLGGRAASNERARRSRARPCLGPGAQTSRRPPPRRHPRCPPPTLSWLCSAPVAQWIEQRFSKSICSGLAAVAVGNRRTFVGRSLLDRLECGLELAEFLVGECAEVGALIRAECFLDDR